MGGEPRVRELVDRFYDLMDLEPRYARLRAAHGTTLDSARDKLFWFLCGWLGGPDHYISRFGHPRLRARHLPFRIGIAELGFRVGWAPYGRGGESFVRPMSAGLGVAIGRRPHTKAE